jgi:hypothetical protein
MFYCKNFFPISKTPYFCLFQGVMMAAKGCILLVFGYASAHRGVEIFPEMIFRWVAKRDSLTKICFIGTVGKLKNFPTILT